MFVDLELYVGFGKQSNGFPPGVEPINNSTEQKTARSKPQTDVRPTSVFNTHTEQNQLKNKWKHIIILPRASWSGKFLLGEGVTDNYDWSKIAKSQKLPK